MEDNELIAGLGVDIVEIERFARALERTPADPGRS